MSYINKHEQKLITRRPELVRNLSYAELLERLDGQAAEANELIAKSESKALHLSEVATEVMAENKALQKQVAERDKRIEALEAEIERLRKKITRKAGKHKDEEWDE